MHNNFAKWRKSFAKPMRYLLKLIKHVLVLYGFRFHIYILYNITQTVNLQLIECETIRQKARFLSCGLVLSCPLGLDIAH